MSGRIYTMRAKENRYEKKKTQKTVYIFVGKRKKVSGLHVRRAEKIQKCFYNKQ